MINFTDSRFTVQVRFKKYVSESIKVAHHANLGFHPQTQNLELCLHQSPRLSTVQKN